MHSKSIQPAKSLCLISARNLGDAVIHARFLRRLIEYGYAKEYLVWTFPQAKFLFDALPTCTVMTSDFPMGSTMRKFVRGGFVTFTRTFLSVFLRKPEVVLEFVSDFRERALSALLFSRRRLYLHWELGHPFRKHNHIPKWRGNASFHISSMNSSIYEAYNNFYDFITGDKKPVFDVVHEVKITSSSKTIGIHPVASQPCKSWPVDHWRELIAELLKKNYNLIIFGAPADIFILNEIIEGSSKQVEVFTKSIPEFLNRLNTVQALIGLDSFSVHLANDRGIPTILLNGSNDPKVFSPIPSLVVNNPKVCAYQPCYGRPVCIGSDFQYLCMGSIEVFQVLNKVASIFEK
jgi:heptosyltransferase III